LWDQNWTGTACHFVSWKLGRPTFLVVDYEQYQVDIWRVVVDMRPARAWLFESETMSNVLNLFARKRRLTQGRREGDIQ
jgi:hypothetical protein